MLVSKEYYDARGANPAFDNRVELHEWIGPDPIDALRISIFNSKSLFTPTQWCIVGQEPLHHGAMHGKEMTFSHIQ